MGGPTKTKILGRVYRWRPQRHPDSDQHLELALEPLHYLDVRPVNGCYLSGRYVEVDNVGEINVPVGKNGGFEPRAMGNAAPDENGQFLFDPGIGGGRLDKVNLAEPGMRARYVEAARFGEVNAYYHVTRMAEHINELLAQLGEKSLPKVRVLINAHHAATEREGQRDGVRGKISGRWLPFQGGHYRLPGRNRSKVPGCHPVWPAGEIHLGAGWRLTREGWLPRLAGRAYRCNASHNAGIIYHEYGHHVARHTADFRANRLKAPHRQDNRKTMTDEAICDYWAASMLNTPHIWCWHRRHDQNTIHPRSLVSEVSMADFNQTDDADPHTNGTILASALWELRRLIQQMGDSASDCDRLILAALLQVARLQDHPYRPSVKETRRFRHGFPVFAACLLHVNASLYDRRYTRPLEIALKRREIPVCQKTLQRLKRAQISLPGGSSEENERTRDALEKIRLRVPDVIIPQDHELLQPDDLDAYLRKSGNGPYHVVAVGDIMLSSRARRPIRQNGPDYPFFWVMPILRRCPVVLGNLEGPFARHAPKQKRNHAYKVDPKQARILRRAGFNVMNLANNHLLDCGRAGCTETLAVLARQQISHVGAGPDAATAHNPAVLQAGAYRIGLLGYYWNRRTAARGSQPGSARDLPDLVRRDIDALRARVHRIVVTVHWGIPYERLPSDEDRRKARYFIDCGADLVLGHHPHVIQPFEIYKTRPILYSLGNFAFGSGNSCAESLLSAIRFGHAEVKIDLFPVYVRNRDLRSCYQPKVLCGRAATRTLESLALLSGAAGDQLEIHEYRGQIRIRTAC